MKRMKKIFVKATQLLGAAKRARLRAENTAPLRKRKRKRSKGRLMHTPGTRALIINSRLGGL